MRCPGCKAAILPESLFCTECGARLEATCPSCGTGNPPTAKFCRRCGLGVAHPVAEERKPSPDSYTPRHLAEKILSTRSALEGERKQVTVLFADLKGSMDLSESIDPEEWHRIMERFFKILTDGVHRFEGTVNEYRGDGIMALFGAPIAHEDHAARACYATLSLQEELRRYANELRIAKGISFSVRMGLNSGEVVVGKIGDDLRMDYTALGHTASLAARMEQIAAPDAAYLTEHTAKLVEGRVSLQDLGKMSVKGVKDAVGVYELRGLGSLRTRLEVSRARGFSKFVGREREMALLEGALERALQGDGQVVGVVAGPGVGKSRLCLEFVERCRSRGIFVNEGHCPAHGKVVPYLPMLELWRSYFAITEKDPDPEARRKIAGTLLLLDPGMHETLPVVFEFLGVTDPERPPPRMDPEAKQRQLVALMRNVIQLHTERQPVVVLIDDLHWIDRASDAWVGQFAEVANGRRFLLLVNFRPEYDAPWMKRSWYQQLPLLPLGPEAVEELLVELLGEDPSVAKLRERIRDRTGGNPFFVEEVVQSLTESGNLEGRRGEHRLSRPIESIEIPATVQAVLASRIDRLPPREKELLQTAAVIGKTFPESILTRVAGLSEPDLRAALAVLEQAELVFAEVLYPEAEYAFKHPLTQEVAYKSQLRQRRAELHAATARAIEEVYRTKLDEQAALLAHHWEEAGDALEAARWHRRAAEWAGRTNPREALRHWQRVRTLARELPETHESRLLGVAACSWILAMGWRFGTADDDMEAILAEGRALAERNQDVRSVAVMLGGYGAIRLAARGGSAQEMLKYSREAVRLAQEAKDRELELLVTPWLVYGLTNTGGLREIVQRCDEALSHLPADWRLGPWVVGFSTRVALLHAKGWALSQMGRLEDAASILGQALVAANEEGEIQIGGWAHSHHVAIAELKGEIGSALEHAHRGVDIAEKAGDTHALVFAYACLGAAFGMKQEWGEAVAILERARRVIAEGGSGLNWEAYILAHLAGAYHGVGDFRQAGLVSDAAIDVGRKRSTPVLGMPAYPTRACILRSMKGASAREEIANVLREAAALIDETGAEGWRPFVHEELGALAELSGDAAGRERELREAHRLFIEMGATGHAARVAKVIGT